MNELEPVVHILLAHYNGEGYRVVRVYQSLDAADKECALYQAATDRRPQQPAKGNPTYVFNEYLVLDKQAVRSHPAGEFFGEANWFTVNTVPFVGLRR